MGSLLALQPYTVNLEPFMMKPWRDAPSEKQLIQD
jgi:hypothetical protein